MGDGLQRSGIAVANIWFTVSPEHPLREAGTAVARAITEIDKPDRYTRVILAGRGLGASLAALLALDKRFAVQRVDGVVAVRGTFEMQSLEAHQEKEREFYASKSIGAEASAITLVRADAPPFLLLNGGEDGGNWPRQARTFARALRQEGGKAEAYVIPDRTRQSVMYWAGEAANELGQLVRGFITSGPTKLPEDTELGVRQRWTNEPPLNSDDLRANKELIKRTNVDAQLFSTLMVMFQRWPFELNQLAGKTYESIDLNAWLAKADAGKGDFLVVKNIRGEQLYFSREEIEQTKPVIVVGLDDETNLNRIFTPYRLKQTYSWKKEPAPPWMVRPLGAFLHFPTAPPATLANKSYAPYGLTAKSFKWVAKDPLAESRDLTGTVRDTMLGEQGCVKCHAFRGAQVKAHHVQASNGEAAGAFALALEDYPRNVLQSFLFEQEKVAKGFDVSPLRVDPTTARQIFTLVKTRVE